MKKILITSILLIMSVSFADTKMDIATCAAKEADGTRLICYDNLAKKLNVDKPKSKISVGTGKWTVSENTSPIDDSKTVIMRLIAESSVGSGYKEHLPTMILRCSENKTNAYINIGSFLGSDTIRVLNRLDKNKAITKTWTISTDHKAIFAPGSNVTYIKSLMKHNKLLIQLTPYSESPVMTTFDLRGLKEAVVPLRKACHW